MTALEPEEAPAEAIGESAEGTSSRPEPILARLGVEVPAAPLWQQGLAGVVVLLIAYAVFTQLFRDGGLALPGEGAEASWPILGPAIAAVILAVIIDLRLTLRALLAIPVIALIGLAILTFASGSWTTVLPAEATRLGMALAAYVLIAVAAAVAATRLTVLPLAGLLVAVAVVAGAMGLWGFANLETSSLAVINQGELTPAGPFRYRNTLALLAAATLIPLARWAVWDSLEPPRALLSIVAGLGLGVSVTVVATSGSDFAWLMSFVLVAVAVLFPGGALGVRRQVALGIAAASFVVAFAGWLMFREVLGQTAGDQSGRKVVMVGLVVAMPLVAWAFGLGARRISDRVATRLVQAAAALAVVGAIAFVVGPFAPGDVTQSRQAYYEATIGTAKEEPIKGFGAGSYGQASIGEQLTLLSSQTRFAHSIPGEMWVELGIGVLLLSLLLYVGAFLLSWRVRALSGGALLIPLVVGFLLSGLIDWSWHMTAMTALWASGLGGLIGIRLAGSADRNREERAEGQPEVISGSPA